MPLKNIQWWKIRHHTWKKCRVYMMIWYAASLFACLGLRNTYEKTMDFRPTVCNALSTVLMILYCTLSLSSVSVFLYFNF